MTSNMVRIHTAHSQPEADIIKSALEDSEIPTYIQGYNHRALLGLMGPYIELHILVPAVAEAEAREILADTYPDIDHETVTHVPTRHDALRPRSKMVAALLCVIFPGLGSCYAGNRRLGIPLLIVTGILVFNIWALVRDVGGQFDLVIAHAIAFRILLAVFAIDLMSALVTVGGRKI
jgi:hypothetical protein